MHTPFEPSHAPLHDRSSITHARLCLKENQVQYSRQPATGGIAMIYTGGTIGMVASDKGLIPGENMAERLLARLQHLPKQRLNVLPDIDLLTLPRLIDSANATPEDWLNLNRLLRSYSESYRAFIILQGTDTLAYTASALSFLLPAELPCIVTGSQYPLETEGSDALDNVESALLTAADLITCQQGQCSGLIVFGGKVLQGNRSTKVSTHSPQGFDSINAPPLGYCKDGTLTWHNRTGPRSTTPVTETLCVSHATDRAPPQVVILKLWPGIQAQQITSLLADPVKGIVLESYGSGNAPDLNQPLLRALKAACDRGVIIVNRSQCPQGAVSNSYAAGTALAEAGVIEAGDMTCEAAFCKLTLLLHHPLAATDPEVIKAAFRRNLRGEITVADDSSHKLGA